jgi:hypothetical protein
LRAAFVGKDHAVGAERLCARADADGGGQVAGDAVLAGQASARVSDEVLKDSVGPGEDFVLVQVLTGIGDAGAGEETRIGIAQALRLVERRLRGCVCEPLLKDHWRQEKPLVPEPRPPGMHEVLLGHGRSSAVAVVRDRRRKAANLPTARM